MTGVASSLGTGCCDTLAFPAARSDRAEFSAGIALSAIDLDFESRLVKTLETTLPRILDAVLTRRLGHDSTLHSTPEEQKPVAVASEFENVPELSSAAGSGIQAKSSMESSETLASLLRDALQDANSLVETLRATARQPAAAAGSARACPLQPHSGTRGDVSESGEQMNASKGRITFSSCNSGIRVTERSGNHLRAGANAALETRNSFNRVDTLLKRRYIDEVEGDLKARKKRVSTRIKSLVPPLPMQGNGWIPRLVRAVHSPYFDLVVTILIVANSFNTGYQMNSEALFEAERMHRLARGESPGTNDAELTTAINQALTFLYVVEVALRLFTDRSLFFPRQLA